MYITWKYDQFPYELCAEVIKDLGNNCYQVKGYNSMEFYAKRKLTNEVGVKVKDMLERAAEAYREDIKKVETKHRNYLAVRFVNMTGLK